MEADQQPVPVSEGRRVHLPLRKAAARKEARRRLTAFTRTPVSASLVANSPIRHPLSSGQRLARVLASLTGSVGLHAGIVIMGLLLAGSETGQRERIPQEVTIQMREPPPPPPPPIVVEETKPETPIVTPEPPKPVPRKIAAAPPPPVDTPPPREPPKTPPPRIVGLSLESTTEGGGGPAFAVGNTRGGQTADRARDPKEVPAVGVGPADAPSTPNAVASRLPATGVTYTQPKRRRLTPPPYPDTLKAQGIEADVTVLVTVDDRGRVVKVKIIKPAPYPEFNEAAERAARAEEFDPATRDGTPIQMPLTYTYRFRLEDQ